MVRGQGKGGGGASCGGEVSYAFFARFISFYIFSSVQTDAIESQNNSQYLGKA